MAAPVINVERKLCITPFISHLVCFCVINKPFKQDCAISNCTNVVFCALRYANNTINNKGWVYPAFPTYCWNIFISNLTSSQDLNSDKPTVSLHKLQLCIPQTMLRLGVSTGTPRMHFVICAFGPQYLEFKQINITNKRV